MLHMYIQDVIASLKMQDLLHSLPLPQSAPPSRTMLLPLICVAAREERYTTAPAMSSGLPSLPLGCCFAITSAPPWMSIKPDAILEGKKPGDMLLQRMCRGPSSTARLRVRWIAAARRTASESARCHHQRYVNWWRRIYLSKQSTRR
jgi:hypothetical protein